MSQTKGQTFRYRLETKPKHFGIVPNFVLLRTDCFDLVQNLLSWTKKKWSPSMGQIREQTQCAADFSLLNLPKGKSLGRSKPATNS